MSLRIYLDDCAYSKRLVRLLQEAGHEVTTPVTAGTLGQRDRIHLRYAADHGMPLLTKNPGDFLELHEAYPDHAGILAIYQDNDIRKDMTYVDVVQAIDRLLSAGVEIKEHFHILNAWR